MNIGQIQIQPLDGGRFKLDGGAMFGIVPKPLWSRVTDVDAQNRIPLATNCLLIRTPRHNALVDTGVGIKHSAKERSIYEIADADPLKDSLAMHGLTFDRLDAVILSHLHFDHAGGLTRLAPDGQLTATFPNAEVIVQRAEWEAAVSGLPEWIASYPPEHFELFARSGRLRLIQGDTEILPGISSRLTAGHSPGHQAIVIHDGNETGVYLGDICPTWNHLPGMWCMAYDADLTQVRRIKPVLLGQIADEGWWALSDHDPRWPCVRIERDPKRQFRVLTQGGDSWN